MDNQLRSPCPMKYNNLFHLVILILSLQFMSLFQGRQFATVDPQYYYLSLVLLHIVSMATTGQRLMFAFLGVGPNFIK